MGQGYARWTNFISVVTVFELERGVLLMERRDQAQGKILWQWLTDYVLAGYVAIMPCA